MGDHKSDEELAKSRRSTAGKSLLMVGKSTQFLGRSQALVYMPTYQLEPKTMFHLPTVLKIINDEMDEHFTYHKYNVGQSPAMALKMTSNLVKQCKDKFDRYRIICVVSIGQRRSQSIMNALTMLWDHERDNYADVSRENTTCFLQATVIGIYFD